MPDLTLYESDVELIRDALAAYKRTLREKATQRIVDDSVMEEIQTCERLGDLLLDRLVQRLHPKRDAPDLVRVPLKYSREVPPGF